MLKLHTAVAAGIAELLLAAISVGFGMFAPASAAAAPPT